MSFFTKLKSSFATYTDDIKDSDNSTNTASSKPKQEEHYSFRNKRLEARAIQALNEIENECFPKQVNAIYKDTSNKYVSSLAFGAISPQGMTCWVEYKAYELMEAEKDGGLVDFLKDNLATNIFNVIGNLELQEAQIPGFIDEYELQYNENLTHFHINEDLLTTTASNMYFSTRLDDYPANNSSTIRVFSMDDLKVIREVNREIQSHLGLDSVAPMKCRTKASNGYFVDVITWKLKDCAGRFNFNIYPVDERINISKDQYKSYYYSQIRSSVLNRLGNITPELAKAKYKNGLKDLSLEEIRSELDEIVKLAKRLPEDYSKLGK